MADIKNYKCPACTGTMHFVAASQKVECDYCGSDYDVAEIEKLMEESTDLSSIDTPDEWTCDAQGWDPAGMQAYQCPSCGAQLICDDTTAATSCPYCGNPTIVPEMFAGTLQPEVIIPFKLEKQQAIDKLKKHYGKKLFLPSAFKDMNHIEDVKGVYVPFWLYDGVASGNAVYHAEKTKTTRQGDYEVKKTDYYVVHRAGEVKFEKIPADASTKMPDDLMDSIEPYDYKELKPFSKGYMAGYLADRYDVTKEENAKRAKSRAAKTLQDMFDETVTGYNTRRKTIEHTNVKQGKITYAMMPVWLLSTKYNNQNYMFAMNGQTGKLVGNLPMDKVKALLTSIIVFIVTFLFGMLIGDGFNTSTAGIAIKFIALPCCITLLCFLGFKSQLNSVRIAKTSRDYIVGNGLRLSRKDDRFLHSREEKRKINKN